MAGVARHGRVVVEVLLIDLFNHLDHVPCSALRLLLVAREIPSVLVVHHVAKIAVDAEGCAHEVHGLLELQIGHACQELNVLLFGMCCCGDQQKCEREACFSHDA
jgi:hypothetical protein